MKITQREIPPLREKLRKQQRNKCPLCGCDLDKNKPSLDHDHETGAIRGVLCRWCNSQEGRVLSHAKRASRGDDPVAWLERMLRYIRKHRKNPRKEIHPTHGKPKPKRRRRRR